MFVVFDLDGTLADISHRVHHVRDGKRDWPAFFAACPDDAPNKPVIAALLAHHWQGHRVEVWSARSDVVRAETEAWLEDNRIPARLLTHMRAAGDSTPDTELKRFWLNQLHERERPDVIYDDRQRVVDMWREEGIACFQVAANWEQPAVTAPIKDPILTLMVGPSGAGKSTWAEHHAGSGSEIVSTDALRREYTNDIRDQSRNKDVFAAQHRLVRARLDSGLPVIVDSTNLRRRDRLALVALAPAGVGVRYVVVDRPLPHKVRDGGWRNVVMIGDESLVAAHHNRMQSVIRDVLAGDGFPQVTVLDERQLGEGPRCKQPSTDLRNLVANLGVAT